MSPKHLPCLLGALTLAAAVSGCKRKIEAPAPIDNGSFVTYSIIEQQGDSTQRYEVSLRFTKADDELTVQIARPDGASTAKLDLETRPLEGELSFPLKSGHKMDLGLLFIPPKDRRPGVNNAVGKMLKRRRYKKWDVWEIISRKGGGQGSYFFEHNTGMLVGRTVRFGKLDVVAEVSASG